MATRHPYSTTRDLEGIIPVFPLSGVILLPHTQLPLNVFEPRYIAMIDYVLAGERLLGIVQPARRDVATGLSPMGNQAGLRSVGTVGRLTAFQETDDQRYLISLTGVCRFEIVAEEERDHPFRTMRVSYDRFAHDLAPPEVPEEVDRARLLSVLRRYLTASGLAADWSTVETASTAFLVNTLSMICPYGSEEKQALLEAADVAGRAEALIALAEMELATGGNDGPPSALQ
ncbi:MAG: peptidase S16 [Rhizobiales bacterium]|nr:peptidase S16 [Hyphomicrobiales bacterium]